MTPNEFRQIRAWLGFTVKEMADWIGYKPDTVYKFEEGARQITDRTAQAIRAKINERYSATR